MSKKFNFGEVRISPFNKYLLIAVGDDTGLVTDKLIKTCKGGHVVGARPTSRALFTVYEDENGHSYLLLAMLKKLPVSAIAHECFHVLVWIGGKGGLGDPITEGSDECYAYVLERLVDEVIGAYKELGGEITV